MGFFDKLAQVAFKDQEDGTTVYYRNGVFNKGRVISNDDVLARIYRHHKNIYKYGLPVGLFYGVFVGLGGVSLESLLPLLIGTLLIYIRQWFLIRKLPIHDSKLKFKETFRQGIQVLPKWYFYLLGISSLMVLGLSFYLPLTSNKPLSSVSWWPIGMAVFGVVGLALTVKLYKLRPHSKPVEASARIEHALREDNTTTEVPAVKNRLNTLAGVTIVFILLCIYWTSNASKGAAQIVGPSTIAASEKYLAVDVGPQLFILGREGEILTSVSYKELGLPELMGKMQWRGETLYMANADTGRLYFCDMPELSCGLLKGFENMARRVFGFYVTEDKIYIADTARHQLRVYDTDGNLQLSERGSPVPLCYPNQIMQQGNYLFVADTNNHRIVKAKLPLSDDLPLLMEAALGNKEPDQWKQFYQRRALPDWCSPIADKVLGESGNPYFERGMDFNERGSVLALDGLRDGRVWPTAFSFDPNGDLWVIAGGDNLQGGDLIVFKEGQYSSRANLSDTFDPVGVVSFMGDMIVSDQSIFRLTRFSLYGSNLGDFGSREFNEVLQGIYHEKENLKQQQSLAQSILIALVFVAFGIAIASKMSGHK
ncbi:MAG: hypothetical protein QNK32_02430 [Porticoccus sp.]|nr:hypothetical protein [Porticoccus sp.]